MRGNGSRQRIQIGCATNHALSDELSQVQKRAGTESLELGPFAMNVRPGIDLTHALEIADAFEDEEIVRKRELGK